jgi:alpha-ketoglutarate-dependent taurine dioxygenase
MDIKHKHTVPCVNDTKASLKRHGWAIFHLSATDIGSLEDNLLAIATCFGKPVSTRNTKLVDRLCPTPRTEAHPKSLSSIHGTGTLPWHIDMAHRLEPARFIMLACENAGEMATATELMEWRNHLTTSDDLEAARTEPFLIQNGRNSFYSTLLDHSRPFLRYDPVCMKSTSERGRKLQEKLSSIKPEHVIQIKWEPFLAVVIDNWRMLHRRLDATHALGRTILRVSIMEGK